MNAVQFTGVIRAWLVVKREKHALFLTLWNQARHKKFAKIVVQLILYQILIHITHLSFTSTKLILYCTLLHVNFAPQFAVTRRKHKKKTLRFKFALKLSIRIIIIARQRIGCGEPSETSANFYMNQISNLIMEAFIGLLFMMNYRLDHVHVFSGFSGISCENFQMLLLKTFRSNLGSI